MVKVIYCIYIISNPNTFGICYEKNILFIQKLAACSYL